MSKKVQRIVILAAVLLVCAGIDQATKALARQHLAGAPPRELAGGILRIEYVENPGAFLSLGASLSEEARFLVFTVFVTLLLTGLLVFALRMSPDTSLLVVIAMALVIGGGVSNLIDRLLNEGRVTDFMQLGLGRLHTGVFNVADVAIMVGLGLMLLTLLLERPRDGGKPQEGAAG